MVGRAGAVRVEGVAAGLGAVALAGERTLPVADALRPVLPGGLRCGSTVLVEGTSLALAVAAGAAVDGSWVAGLGLPSMGLVAADQLGIPLGRLVMVAAPGEAEAWATAAATLVDAFPVVLVGGRRVGGQVARRLSARVRDRGAVLVVVGDRRAWPEAPDVRLSVAGWEWEGLEAGHGFLSRRRTEVTAEGRRGAARLRRAALWLPDRAGGAAAVDEEGQPVVEPTVPARWGA